MTPAFAAQVLRRHSVQYFVCDRCGLLQTEKPHWLAEAYSNPIDESDTGLVERCLLNRDTMEAVAHRLAGDDARLVDVGGGYGLLTRLLRDRGFDCYTHDPYSQNLFARGFEPPKDFRADVLMAFEVLEHVERPREFLRESFETFGCRTIVFSTTVFAGAVPATDWWYYSFDAGQHITFYQKRTLARLAVTLGCTYQSMGGDLHLISDRPLDPLDKALFSHRRLFSLYQRVVRYARRDATRTWQDHLRCKATLDAKSGGEPPPS